MKRLVTIIVLTTYLVMIVGQSEVISSTSSMNIISILDGVVVGDQGMHQNIQIGDFYEIYKIIDHDKYLVGEARVISLKLDKTVLAIIRSYKEITIKKGDKLIKSKKENSEASIHSNMQATQFNRTHLTNKQTNYYLTGREQAKTDYRSGGAVVGGLVAGFGLGIIGWGIGYAIISGKKEQTPALYLTNLNDKQKYDYAKGYRDQIQSTRKSAFNGGAGIGLMMAILVVLSINTN